MPALAAISAAAISTCLASSRPLPPPRCQTVVKMLRQSRDADGRDKPGHHAVERRLRARSRSQPFTKIGPVPAALALGHDAEARRPGIGFSSPPRSRRKRSLSSLSLV